MPSAVGAIPVVGDLMRGADAQAQWVTDLLEQNARLVGQLPATLKSFNDALERFNQTVTALDRSVTRIEKATRTLTGPLDRAASVAGALDPAGPEYVAPLYTYLVSELSDGVTGGVFAGSGGFIGRFPTPEAQILAYRDYHDNPPWTPEEIDGLVRT